jgi:hypothetical protein
MVINFKVFNYKEYERTFGNSWSGNDVMFMCPDNVVRIGHLYDEYHGNGHTTYYFKSCNTQYRADQCRYADITIKVEL